MDDNANYFHNLQVFSPASQLGGRKEEMNIHNRIDIDLNGMDGDQHTAYIMQGVFDDIDKDFTIWEYREDIKKLLECAYFVRHIYNHFKNEHPDWKVCCKICGDYIEKINANDKVKNGR